MARPTKENTSFSMKISSPVYKRFRSYAEKLGQSYTVCLERIITEYLDEKGFLECDGFTNKDYGNNR